MKMFKRITSLLLVMMLLIGMIPTTTFAAESEQRTTETENIDFGGANGLGNLLASEINQKENADSHGEYSEGCGISSVTIEGNAAAVTYKSVEEAVLVVAIYSEDGVKMIDSTKATVEAGENTSKIEFACEMPEYYVVRAFLMDSYTFEPLCKAFENMMYTRQMKSLLSSTIHDYKAELVWNLNEDETTNFAVLEEDVVRIPFVAGTNDVASVDNENATYVIENADSKFTSLKKGDIIFYEYGVGQVLIARVGDIKVNGNTVTITGGELDPEDVFSHLKMEVDTDSSKAQVDVKDESGFITYDGTIANAAPRSKDAWQDSGVIPMVHKFTLDTQNINGEISKVDKASLKATISLFAQISFEFNITYDFYIADNYKLVEFKLTPILTYDFQYEGSIDASFTLAEVDVPTGVPGLFITLEPSVGLSIKGELELWTQNRAVIGFGYYNGDKVNLCEKPVTLDGDKNKYEISFEISFDFGVGVTLGEKNVTNLCLEFMFHAPLTFAFDIEKQGKETRTKADTRHACENCVSLEIGFKVGVGVELEFFDGKWTVPIISLETRLIPFWKGYASADLGKRGTGECPNKEYRQTLKIVNGDRRPMANVTIIDQNGEKWDKSNARGMTSKFLDGTTKYTLTFKYKGEETKAELIQHGNAGVTTIIFDLNAASKGNAIVSGDNEAMYDEMTQVAWGEDKNIIWRLYSNGLLRITGEGAMQNNGLIIKPGWNPYVNGIVSVEIGEGITTVGKASFRNCINLQSVKLPESITEIGSEAFEGCKKLTQIVVPKSVTQIGSSAFSSCISLEKVELSDSITEIGKEAFTDCSSLKEFKIPAGMEIIRSGLLRRTGLTSVSIPSNIKEIESYAFYECKKLTSVEFSEGLTNIKDAGFMNCASLNNVVLPDTLISIETCAFSQCSSLTNFNFGNGIEDIGDSAFTNCDSLVQVVIPASVKQLRSNAFAGCEAFSIVKFMGHKPKMGLHALGLLQELVIFYPANDPEWESTARESEETDIFNKRTWIPFTVSSEEGDSHGTSSYGLSAPATTSEVDWKVNMEVVITDNYLLRKATFTDLIANQEYILVVLADAKAEDTLGSENLLYIAQVAADESGTVNHSYALRNELDGTYIIMCGSTGKDIKDAEITLPKMEAGNELMPVTPTVVWNGETLLEGQDYVITGQGAYIEGGTYTCTIQGINTFDGAVDVEYTVEDGIGALVSNPIIIVIIVIVLLVAVVAVMIYIKKSKRRNENKKSE